MTQVANRRVETLLPLTQAYVQPGTHIVTDGFASYNNIVEVNDSYSHNVIIHADYFVNPINSNSHTQNIV